MRTRLLLALAALVAFGAGLIASFHFDDYALFADPAIAAKSGWWQVWRAGQTRPLTYFTFWLNHQIGDRNPLGYHAVNLALHLAVVLLLYVTLARVIPDRAALIAAALFAVHPIQTEAVSYVFARATLLMTLFSVLSLRDWVAGRQWRAVLWFALGLLAKEECVALPVLLLLFHVSERRERREWRAIAAGLTLALAAGGRVLWATKVVPGASAGFQSQISPLDYFRTQGLVILRYFRLVLWPVGFNFDPDIHPAGFAGWLAWAGIAALAVAAWRHFRQARNGYWFIAGLVLLLPSSTIFPVLDLAADRRLYLPMIAFSAFGGLLLLRVKPVLLGALLVLLVALSVDRTLVWKSEESLWSDVVRKSPEKVRPKIQLARAVPPDRALPLLEEAKRIAPRDAEVAAEIGRTYLEAGKPAEALAEFGRALALAPGDPRALNNRGAALLALGQPEAARADFERALLLDPCLYDARVNLLRLGVRAQDAGGCRYTPEQERVLSGK